MMSTQPSWIGSAGSVRLRNEKSHLRESLESADERTFLSNTGQPLKNQRIAIPFLDWQDVCSSYSEIGGLVSTRLVNVLSEAGYPPKIQKIPKS
jgi:hypothetical protein